MAKATARALDMTDVKDGSVFNKKHQREGDYRAKILSVEDAKPKDKSDKTPMWLFAIKAGTGVYPYYCKLQANQLWKVRNLAIAAGISVPKKKIKLDPNKLVGKDIAITLEDTEYDGKMQSEIAATFPLSELDADDDEYDDEEDDEEDEDEDEEDEEDDEDEDDEDDDEDEDDEDEDDEEEVKPKKKKGKAKSSAKSKKSKKSKKKDDDDDDLDELDIDDV